jgi:hypothetical protein
VQVLDLEHICVVIHLIRLLLLRLWKQLYRRYCESRSGEYEPARP